MIGYQPRSLIKVFANFSEQMIVFGKNKNCGGTYYYSRSFSVLHTFVNLAWCNPTGIVSQFVLGSTPPCLAILDGSLR